MAATILSSPLTYRDIGRIVNDFDHAHFGVPKTSEGLAKEYRNVHFALLGLQSPTEEGRTAFPIELVDHIARNYIESAPSVRALLMLYRGAPSLKTTALRDDPSERFLNGAARVLLCKAKFEPSIENEPLVHFKQLMNAVFIEYFNSLSHADKLTILQKFHQRWELPKEWEQNSPEEKLNAIQGLQGQLPDRASRAKVNLQFFSWKVQLVAGRVLQNPVFKGFLAVGIFSGSAYLALRLYSLKAPIVNCFGFLMEKIFEIGLGPNWMTRNDLGVFDLSKMVVITISMVAFGVVASLKVHYLIQSYGDHVPWVLGYPVLGARLFFKFLENPLGTVVQLPFQISAYALQRVNAISKLMDAIAIQNSQRQYINAQLPDLLVKWQHLVLNPPALSSST